MVASAVFITDLQGKSIISRDYRGDYPTNKAIEVFSKYLGEVEEEARKPIFHVDVNGDFESGDNVGMTGPGGQTFVYVAVSTDSTQDQKTQKCQKLNSCWGDAFILIYPYTFLSRFTLTKHKPNYR